MGRIGSYSSTGRFYLPWYWNVRADLEERISRLSDEIIERRRVSNCSLGTSLRDVNQTCILSSAREKKNKIPSHCSESDISRDVEALID